MKIFTFKLLLFFYLSFLLLYNCNMNTSTNNQIDSFNDQIEDEKVTEKENKLIDELNKISSENLKIIIKENELDSKIKLDKSHKINQIEKLSSSEKNKIKKEIQSHKNNDFWGSPILYHKIIDNFRILREYFPSLDVLLNIHDSKANRTKKFINNEGLNELELYEKISNILILDSIKQHYNIINKDPDLKRKYDIQKENYTYEDIAKLNTVDKKELKSLLKKYSNYEINFKNYTFKFGYESRKHSRSSMEDNEVYSMSTNKNKIIFGVFDGHGGEETSEYVSKKLHKDLFDNLKEIDNIDSEQTNQKIKEIIKTTFLEFDEKMCKDPSIQQSGSTSIITLIINNKLYLINLGDSRGLIVKNNEVIQETKDHKPDDPDEEARITKANGTVSIDKYGTPRVDSDLAVSRAFGDKYLKKYENKNDKNDYFWVSPIPKIYGPFDLPKKNDEFYIILACDGVWDAIDHDYGDNKIILDILDKNKMKSQKEISDIIVQKVIDKGSTDNITAMVIEVNQNK
ncbi:MAG: protein serine/threonine phosphatase 2C family protein [Bacteroidetes bacterium]|nr:protein serine/threonine phosphatase 2C family protein [Bacteroidota bacterium]